MSDHIFPLCERNLALGLSLKGSGKPLELQTGHIETLDMNLNSFEFTFKTSFRLFDDSAQDLFDKPDAIHATLTFKAIDPNSAIFQEKGAPWLEIEGIVTAKDLLVEPSEQIDLKRPERVYTICVEDPAKVTWRNHYPEGVYVDKSFKQIFEEMCNPEIKVKYDWAALENQNKITAFSLEKQNTSFYSFLAWILHKENGVWSYDYKAKSYAILGKKHKVDGKPLEIDEDWVVFPKLVYPRTAAYSINKRKRTFNSVESQEENNPKAFKQVYHDVADPGGYSRYPKQSPELVKSVLIPQKNRLSLTFQKFEDFGLDQLLPGCAIKFLEKQTVYWSGDACFKGKTFRVRELSLKAHKVSKTLDKPSPMENYHISLITHLEEEDEPFIERPSFIPPVYPFECSGTIFSDVGDKERPAAKIQKADDSPLGFYLVKVPDVKDGKNMVVPLALNLPGHFHFPFGKGEEVVFDMYLHTADNIRSKGYHAHVQPPDPTGTQTKGIVFDSKGPDECTRLYQTLDADKPVWAVEQKSSATQLQKFQIQKQEMALCVEEKDKMNQFFQITQETGVTLSREDKNASITQQINFNKDAITLFCKGSGGESKIVLKPDSIALITKTLSISAEDFNVEAKNQVAMKGKNKIGLESSSLDAPVKKAKLG